MRRLLLILVLLLGALPAAQAAVVHVSAAATGTGDGSSWANACATLQAGLARASNGDQVWIAQGTYVPGGSASSTFTIPDGVSVYGGFLGTETALLQRRDDPDLVVLDGEIGTAGFSGNISTMITMPGSGRIDTLTVTRANYVDTISGNNWYLQGAAGVYATGLYSATVSVVRCRFINIRAHGPQVIHCINATTVIDRCEFIDCQEFTADPQRNPRSAVVSAQHGTSTIVNSVFATISSLAGTGNLSYQTSAVLADASSYQGSVVRNCVFTGCQTYAAVLGDNYSVRVEGCTFVGNSGRNLSGPNCRGSILGTAPYADQLYIDENNWRVQTDGDPLFTALAQPAGPDGVWFTADDGLRLQHGSLCIDRARFITATTGDGMPTSDILGLPRPRGHDPDCGAYEYDSGNTGPFALAASVVVREDTDTPITLSGSDADGDGLTAIITGLPDRGRLYPTIDGTTPSGAALTPSALPWAVPDPQRRVIYRPAADENGVSTSFAFQVSDGAIASYPASVSLTIAAVNDAPTISQTAAMTIAEDAGQQVVALSGISAGTPAAAATDPWREVQNLTVTASSSDPLLIAAPTVSYTSPGSTAQLAFAPVANAYGTAVLTVTVHDDGGTALGGSDTTAMSFAVTVEPVNDPPRMDPVADLVVDEDATGAQLAITGLAAGPASESAQTLTISASSGDPALLRIASIDHAPGSDAATVHLALQPDANGTALVFIAAFDDGGTAMGGTASTARVCQVTVRPVDDPPVLAANPGLTAASNHDTAIPADRLRITDPDGPPAGALRVTVTATPAHGEIRRAGIAILAGGSFTQADVDAGLVSYANAGGISDTDAWSFSWTDGTSAVQGPATMAISLVGSELPTIAIPPAAATWTEGDPPVAFASGAVVADPDAVPWDGGAVTATISAGLSAGDRLSLAEEGVGAGQVSVSDTAVRVGGRTVGVLSAWDGSRLAVALAGDDAAPESAQAIVRALRFGNVGDDPGSAARVITVVVDDGGAGASAPAVASIAVTPVNDPPAVDTAWIGAPAGADLLVRLAATDPDGPALAWSLVDAPWLADVEMSDPEVGILRIRAHADAAGSGSFHVLIDDGIADPVPAEITLVVSGTGTTRPEPAGELPPDTSAGGQLDAVLRFDTAALGGTTGLSFTADAAAPAGLRLDSAGPDLVRVRWSVPAGQPAPAYVRFSIIATDPASRSSGVLPVLLLVRPQPGGGG